MVTLSPLPIQFRICVRPIIASPGYQCENPENNHKKPRCLPVSPFNSNHHVQF